VELGRGRDGEELSRQEREGGGERRRGAWRGREIAGERESGEDGVGGWVGEISGSRVGPT
jgi:hypothetical protein